MRPIKFRAWLSDKVYVEPRMVTWDELISCFDAITIFDVKNMTLMQYTGLKDKNGREVYEGDLFEHKFGYTVFDDPPHAEMGTEYGVVTFDNGQFVVSTPGWGGRNLYELLLLNGHLNDMPDSDMFTMKVAGNIFENPELLEVAEHG